MGEEVHRGQVGDFPDIADAFELEAHLGGAAVLGGEDIGGIGVHFEVCGGGTKIFFISVFSYLEKLIAELDGVMQAKKSRHLVAKTGEVLHVFGIEDGKEPIEAMGLEGSLKFGEDILDDLVGQLVGPRRLRLQIGSFEKEAVWFARRAGDWSGIGEAKQNERRNNGTFAPGA